MTAIRAAKLAREALLTGPPVFQVNGIVRETLVTVWAHGLMQTPQSAVRLHPAAWYNKSEPTFSDAIAAVRRVLWSPTGFSMSRSGVENVGIPLPLLRRFVETLCLAA